MWLDATLVSIAPLKYLSLTTSSPVLTTAKPRVVGIFRLYIDSLIIYSLNIGPKAALPSPFLENAVFPEPLS